MKRLFSILIIAIVCGFLIFFNSCGKTGDDSGPDTTQVEKKSGPDTTQMDTKSGPDTTQANMK